MAQRFVHENRDPPGGGERRRGALLHRRGGRSTRATRIAFGEPLVEEAGGPVSARRAVRRVRDGAQLHLPAPPGRWTARTRWRSATWSRSATSARTGCAARRPTGRCRCMAASATAARCRSSTSTATTAAIASPRATEEVQMRRVAQYLFSFSGKQASTRDDGRPTAPDRGVDFDVGAARRVSEGLARSAPIRPAGRAHAWRHVEPDLFPAAAASGARCCASSRQECAAVGACDRPRISRADGAARQRRAGARSPIATARIARSSARRSISWNGWTAASSTSSRRRDSSRASDRAACSTRWCATLAAIHRLGLSRRSAWPTSAGRETISPASSSAGRSNGRNSDAATTTTRRSIAMVALARPSACPKARPQRFAMATSASPT